MTAPADKRTLEFAKRTQKNLKFIYNAKDNDEDVEEFTQLLNSMLCMVISLREDYFKGRSVTWDYVKNLGLSSWDPSLIVDGKKPSSANPNLKQATSFSQLITKIRHAFAHNCFDLVVEENTKLITGVTIWNIPTGTKNKLENRVWEVEISENQLKSLAYLFVEYLEAVHP
jgi:hypothetical protein